MNNQIDIISQALSRKIDEYKKIIKQLNELKLLEQKKDQLEEEFKKMEKILSLEFGTILSPDLSEKEIKELNRQKLPIIGSLSGKKGKEAYRELAKEYFKNKPFKEKDIREQANKEGLFIKGKPINYSTSWGIISDLLKEEFLYKTKRGWYQYKEQEKEEPSRQKETTVIKRRKRRLDLL